MLLVSSFSQLRHWFERVWNHALSAASPDSHLQFHSSVRDHDPQLKDLGYPEVKSETEAQRPRGDTVFVRALSKLPCLGD